MFLRDVTEIVQEGLTRDVETKIKPLLPILDIDFNAQHAFV